MPTEVTLDTLRGFLDAFNRHDLDAIMSYFHDDCVFYMPRGEGPRGDRYEGRRQVRAGLATRFEGIPDVHYGEDTHWVCGNLGVSEWTLTGTRKGGGSIAVRGVDLLEFRHGKVIRKDSFWKIID
jgi:ketosteroid isomerase-like protein